MSGGIPQEEMHRVVVCCVIYREGDGGRQYLIAKRSPTHQYFPGKWEIPSGGVTCEDGRNDRHAAPDGTWENPLGHATVREVEEEVGVRVDHLEFLSSFRFAQDGASVIGMRFMGRYDSGEARPNCDAVVECRWIKAQEVAEYDFLGTIANAILHADRILSKRSLAKACGLL